MPSILWYFFVNIVEILPYTVKIDIVDFHKVLLKDGRCSVRVVIDRLLTETEKEELRKIEKIEGVDFVAHMKSAPEIKRSYFYVVL